MVSSVVHIIDDEERVCRALSRLLRAYDYNVATYASASDFLNHARPDQPACLLVDLRMPGMSGLELQQSLSLTQNCLSIILMSGSSDIETSVAAMKIGATDFLTKPFNDCQLLSAIETALFRSARIFSIQQQRRKDQTAYESLTPRERQVCVGIADGLLNKQVAFELGTTEKTVKAQRARVMQKLQSDCLPDIVRLVERLRVAGVLAATQYPLQPSTTSLATHSRETFR